MGRLLEGEWVSRGFTTDEKGHFVRHATTLRNWVRADGSTPYAPQSGRYHLYVSYACPWAHRTLITRALLGLDEHVSVTVVDLLMTEEGWHFSSEPGSSPDPIFGKQYLREVYLEADPNFTGRVTVPVLWDRETHGIVNNESREIVRMFNVEFADLATTDIDLSPEGQREAIDAVIDDIYMPINNGVYRCGFAGSQGAYDESVVELFAKLDEYDELLGKQPYVTGDHFTEADICLFTTLVRFDRVYQYHFKCNIRRLEDYENLWAFTRQTYQTPAVKETVNFDHIVGHYYRSHESVNPRGIVPAGPQIDFDAPHDRGDLVFARR